ncbi:MAG: hypothetical protein AAGF12_28785, partial [Myxococcota bacterium]
MTFLRQETLLTLGILLAAVPGPGCGDDAPSVGSDAGDARTSPDASSDAMASQDATPDASPDATVRDIVPPDVTIAAPREGGMSPGVLAFISGTVSDDQAVDSLVWDAPEGEVPIDVDATGEFSATISLRPGENTVRLVARDPEGNEGEASVDVYFGHRVSVGNSQAAYLRQGTLYTWGRNELGQLGNGTLDGSRYGDDPATATLPVRYEVDVQNLVSIVTRQTFMIALHGDGTVSTWGSNSDGQLGYDAEDDCGSRGTSACRRSPTQVEGVANAVGVAAGFDHSLVLLADGTVMSWGSNSDGQLGYTTLEDTNQIPTRVEGLSNIVQLAAGSTSSFALDNAGDVWAWGENDRGQLGLGTSDRDPHPVPMRIAGLTGVRSLASGNATVYALMADGTVMAWGRNQSGQAGVGETMADEVLMPAPVLVRNPD